MLNKSTSRSKYVVQSGVTQYPIGFEFFSNGDDTPQIRVTIGAMVAEENLHFVISEDLLTINLIPLEEEAPVDPNDYSWMDKWVGMELVIERDIPFVQESDYQLGRISPERIEKDFDLSVMRDQILDDKSAQLRKDVDDKLPLSGGTLTGPLTITTDESTETLLTLKNGTGEKYRFIASSNGVQMSFDIYTAHNITPAGVGMYDLGDWVHKWKTVYTTGLSSGLGVDIVVPEKSGTMALLEDLESKADKTELSNYLPLTGGTLTNLLSFDVPGTAGKNKGLIYVNTASGSTPLIGAKTDDNGVLRDVAVIPNLQSTTFQATNLYASFIGSLSNPITRIHAKKIGSGTIGTMLTIPNGPGTIARLEDMPDIYTKEELDAKFAETSKAADTYTKAEVDAKLSSVYKFKGSVANVDALPTSAVVGDTYNVEDTGANYAWDGSKWDKLSDTVDLSDYATVEYVDNVELGLVELVGDETKKRIANDNQLHTNMLVLRDMLNERDENDEFIQLTTEAQTAIPAINELNENKASKEDLAGYLPLSGGELTGPLSTVDSLDVVAGASGNIYRFAPYRFDSRDFVLSYKAAGSEYFTDRYMFSSSCIRPVSDDAVKDLGSSARRWRRVYATIISNGADIAIPTEGGTLARVEDLTDYAKKDDLSGYLPLSGGALTGALSFDTIDVWGASRSFIFRTDGTRLAFEESYQGGEANHRWLFSGNRILCENNSGYDTNFFIGSSAAPLFELWTQHIGTKNGQKIIVPTEGGTIARIEDIDAAVGDISTALAAILGE